MSNHKKSPWLSAVLGLAGALAIGVVACPGGGGSRGDTATLVSIAVTPTDSTIPLGTTRQLVATGTWSDGSSADVTDLATWSSTDGATATVSSTDGSQGLATSLGLGSTTISATCLGRIGSTTLTVADAALLSIEVTPTNPQVALGTVEQFAATGLYTDGTTHDLTAQVVWSSETTSTSTISNDPLSAGAAQSVGLGTSLVTASYSGFSASTTLTVSNAVLVSVDVSPTNPSIALGTTQPFTATGTFSDGSKQDLTAEAVWSSSAATADVSNAAGTHGIASALGLGNATITATRSGVSGSTVLTISSATLSSITVTPTLPSIALGTTQSFTATGTFSDGSVQDLTTQAAWSSSDAAIATIGADGIASTLATGSTTITATRAGVAGSTTLAVSNATLASIEVTPSHPSAALGTTQAFVATGVYTDGSTQGLTDDVVWTSSDAAVATISNADGSSGLATTVAVGGATITATFGGKSGSTAFTVSSAELIAIVVSPDVATLAQGTSLVFSAIGVLSDGSHQDLTDQVTWSTSASWIATVSNAAASAGSVSAVGTGNATITASFLGESGTAALEVTSANLLSIDVYPFVASIAHGTQASFQAFGNYSDGSTQDLTDQVTWSTSNAGVASVSNAAGSEGLVTGTGVGSATITAELSGVAEPFVLDVTSATLESIVVTPASSSVPVGSTCTFQVTGTFSDGSTQDLTDLVTWSSSDAAVATVSNAAGSKGIASSIGSGTTQITASFGGVSSSASLTGTTATLVSVSVAPALPTMPVGYSLSLHATGTYSDGSTRDLASEVLWTSSNASVAQISNAAGTSGRVTAIAVGSAALTAVLPGKNGTASISVTNATLSSIDVEPDPVSLAVAGTRQMTAIGHFSDGSTLDITWDVKWLATPRSVASIGNYLTKGVVTARKAGNTTVRAKKSGKTGTSSLSVSGS